jgi:hypothetical protein
MVTVPTKMRHWGSTPSYALSRMLSVVEASDVTVVRTLECVIPSVAGIAIDGIILLASEEMEE